MIEFMLFTFVLCTGEKPRGWVVWVCMCVGMCVCQGVGGGFIALCF